MKRKSAKTLLLASALALTMAVNTPLSVFAEGTADGQGAEAGNEITPYADYSGDGYT